MITYRYLPYEPEEENRWDLDRLMGLVSEIIMRYNTNLDETLQYLLDRGLPANLFLKEGGMGNLVEQFQARLRQQMEEIRSTFEIQSAISETEGLMNEELQSLSDSLTASDYEQIQNIVKELSLDRLLKHGWEKAAPSQKISALRSLLEDHETLKEGQERYQFHGQRPLSRKEALQLLKNMAELEGLDQALSAGLENGDLLNLDLEELARYLGPESYQEYLEKREEIIQKLKKILEEKGKIIRDPQSEDEFNLSPQSIRRIGQRALAEIFSDLKSDSTGSHDSSEEGQSENLSSLTRPVEFGDSLSAMDLSASFLNAIIRRGQMRPHFQDIEIFRGRGSARSATVILLDMSGSMQRSGRFYHAKRVVMALDALIREEFRDDRLIIVGFGSLARRYHAHEVPALQPFEVTMFEPHIRLRLDMRKGEHKFLPRYFTNLERGLALSRQLLGSGETRNRQIILITDGVPTAHMEGHTLHINYPPSPDDFAAALREVRACAENQIVINTFLLTSDWEMSYFGEESFIQQFARESEGRIFYPHPTEMNKLILMDFIAGKKKLLSA
ncbi:MAG: VWA domain-containing protein [Spirochaetales bacterium]|nr:VWA domain-containing protein [Spirochaetales bacterium]